MAPMDRFDSPLGLALLLSVSVMLGAFLVDVMGWQQLDATDYLLAALGGFVGGFLGGMLRQRRRA